MTINLGQVSALENLYHSGVTSASDFDRSHLEALVNKGMAIKHRLGSAVTYTISEFGKTTYLSTQLD